MRASTVVALAAITASALATTASAQSANPEPYMTDQEYMKKVGTPFPGQFRARNNTFERVTGDLWRAGDGTWYAGVLVTPDGILLVDTLNVPFAKWLKEQLAQRFPGKVVKYVILSHTHWDHVEGSTLFADTAKVIGHENTLTNLDGRYPHMPGDMTDRNDNGRFDRAEIGQPMIDHPWICGGFPNTVDQHDRNHDGITTPAEFFADVQKPDIVYSDRMTLRFGGKTIDLVFPGKNHANDGTAVVFRDERVLFTVDFPQDVLTQNSMQALPSACGPFDGHPLSEWVRSYRTLEALDFDILSGGHGWKTFTRQDITAGREYFEYLIKEVSTAMSKGKGLEEIKKTVKLEKYKDWVNYERLREYNVEAAYYNLKIYK